VALSNKDPQELEDSLRRWLAAQLPEATTVSIDNLEVPGASGMSNTTVLFTASWSGEGTSSTEELVARIAPDGPAIFMDCDLGKEAAVMKAMASIGLPVPAVRWVEDGSAALGAPFLVMERARGKVPADDPPFTAAGWVLELSDQQRWRLCEASLEALAAVHNADWRALGLGFIAPPDGADAFDAEVANWREFYDWARGADVNPTIEAGFAWLDANRPDDRREPVLNWGDARIGNMMFDGDLAVNAILDWEMVSLGHPDMDLAWWLFTLRHHTEGIGLPVPSGFPTRDQVVAIYERAAGRTIDHLDYYEAWAGVRLSILMHRAGNLMIDLGFLPPDAPMKFNNPASQLLAKLIGAEPPVGSVQSFIGNRG
jgi:aminoglycoside phosphotransferase (APT) family kinase protein